MAELLIIVAIIAVLVAIAIPVFNSQLEKSREGTDLANVRAAYAQVMSAVITEDTVTEYDGVPIYDNASGTYMATVPLKQQQPGWSMSESQLNIGGITPAGSQWKNAPVQGGACALQYANGIMAIDWGGVFHDYRDIFLESIMETAYMKNNSAGSNVLNSTWSSANSQFGSVIEALRGNGDVKTWAAVCKPGELSSKKTLSENAAQYNYIFSDIDAKSVEVNTKIPAMYVDKNGNYTVGYATVKYAPDNTTNPYKVITVDPNDKYPMGSGKEYYDKNYDPASLISDGVQYSTNRYAAQAAYQELVKKYKNEHPGS